MAYFSGFLEIPSISETCITDQIDDKAVACTCNDDSNLEWSLLSKSWIEWMEWTVHQVLMVGLECVKRHPKILKTFEKLAFSVNKNSLTHTICSIWYATDSHKNQRCRSIIHFIEIIEKKTLIKMPEPLIPLMDGNHEDSFTR